MDNKNEERKNQVTERREYKRKFRSNATANSEIKRKKFSQFEQRMPVKIKWRHRSDGRRKMKEKLFTREDTKSVDGIGKMGN